MPQKVQKYMNTNELSKTFGKFYVRPVYPKRHIGTNELAEFIQTQCTVKMSDIKAVLVEIGSAFKHYFELGHRRSSSTAWASSRWASPVPAATPRRAATPRW